MEDILGLRRGILLKAARYFIESPDNENKQENWIEAHKAKTGVYPPLPERLAKLVSNYTPGEPIREGLKPNIRNWTQIHIMIEKMPDMYKKWRELLEWLGYEPDDIDELENTAYAQAPPREKSYDGGLIQKRKTI